MTSKIGIIGAGFSGLIAAKSLLKMGFKVEIFEEHSKVGFPEHCTGLVSGNVVDMIGAEAKSTVIKKFNYMNICYKESCLRLKIESGVLKLDRVALEQKLLKSVERAGGLVNLGNKVIKVSENGEIEISNSYTKKYDLVILSEGFHGKLRNPLNIGLPKQFKPLYGVNYEIEESCRFSEPTVIFGNELTKGFFLWEVPLDQKSCLVGGASEDPKSLRRIAQNRGKIRKSYGGPVITGPPAHRCRAGKVFVVGDAAGLNKPLTGGGLYPNALLFKLIKEDLFANPGMELDIVIESALKMVKRLLLKSYRIAKHIHKNPEVVKCIIKSTKKYEKFLPPLEYDDHSKILKDLSKEIPSLVIKMTLNFMLKCPFQTFKLLCSLIQ